MKLPARLCVLALLAGLHALNARRAFAAWWRGIPGAGPRSSTERRPRAARDRPPLPRAPSGTFTKILGPLRLKLERLWVTVQSDLCGDFTAVGAERGERTRPVFPFAHPETIGTGLVADVVRVLAEADGAGSSEIAAAEESDSRARVESR